jgi:hypothetical protein
MLAIVSHDAGGAEVVSSYVRRAKLDCLYTLAGPARKIFDRKLGSIAMTALAEAVSRADSVLCGSSWQSDLEFQAIGLAKAAGKHCVVFLDHWANYAERFERSGFTRLPDEIWVGDRDAEAIAAQAFPGLQIRRVDNPYFQDIRDALNAIPHAPSSDNGRLNVLYVCEPVREHALRQHGDERYWGYTEEEALRYFLSNVAALGATVGRIVIRPHPSEATGKYRWAETEFDLPIHSGGALPLIEEIAASDVVVGCESMAMVVGLLAGKRVVSCIPPGGRVCVLPQAEILHLQRLI